MHEKTTSLDLVLGGNQRVEFSRLFVLDGFQQERHSPIAQQKLKVNPQMVQMQISLTNVKAYKLINGLCGTLLKVQNKKDEDHTVIRNLKHELIAKGFAQGRNGVVCEESLAPVASLEAVWIFVATQPQVFSNPIRLDSGTYGIFNGPLKEEVFVLIEGFVDQDHPEKSLPLTG
ncbi:hypothetical protein Tco_1473800 [Tanacetum coccineum]